jgi:RNA polymerase sigma-70 factor (ECF subfamily)
MIPTLGDDHALLIDAQTSAEGFGRLFDRFYDPLLKYAYRRTGNLEVAQDVAAAVFEDVLRQIKSFEWRGLPLSAWLYRLAANKVANYYRAVYRWAELNLDEANPAGTDQAPLDARLLQADVSTQLNRAILRLSETDQLIINLIYFDELSREEAATILGCKVDNVYVKLHRALKRLKIELTREVTKDDKN